MPKSVHPDCPETLALVIQYLYETDKDFEKNLDRILFGKRSRKFNLKSMRKKAKKLSTLKAKRRKKK